MKEIIDIAKSENFTAVNIGRLDNISEYSFLHPKLNTEVTGKVFLKEPTHATGTEMSFQVLPPETELPYFHIHRQNEETYIILKGSGYFQVDEECFPVTEGSVVRIAPEAKRGLYNSSSVPMTYMVIQSKQDSLQQWSSEDGTRVQCEPKWRNK